MRGARYGDAARAAARLDAASMDHGMSVPHDRTLLTLASAPLPRRVLGVMQRLYALVGDGVGQMLDRMLIEFELELQRLADRAGTPELHVQYMAIIRSVQLQGSKMRPLVLAQLQDALSRIREETVRQQPEKDTSPDFRELRLVDDHDVDERAALTMITARQEARSGLPLLLLGQRFGVLSCTAACDAECLPLGPRRLGQMVSRASEVMAIDASTRLLLFRAFDQQLISHYPSLLDAINGLLIREGILPELSYVPIRKRPQLQNPSSEGDGVEDVLPQVERRAGARRDGDKSGIGDGGRRASDRPLRSYTAWMGESADVMAPEEQRDAFELLRELLSGRRELLGKLRQTQPAAGLAPMAETLVDDGLQRLQAQVREGSTPVPESPQDVRHALLARNRHATGTGSAFSNASQDTFELLGMLYRQIHREVRPTSPSHQLLNRLMVPLLRVATHDARFFIDARHPSRLLLSAVAEMGATWLAPDEIDPQYEAQLRDAVEHVVTFFDGDLRVFDEANQWLDDAATSLQRKAEVSERRFVEAARGREKLEIAKRRGGAAIAEAIDGVAVPRFVRTLLGQAWVDVLTLLWLRHGEDSAEWQEHFEATRQIVRVSQGEPAPDGLESRIHEGMQQVGYHADDALLIARHLVGAIAEDSDEAATRTELAMRIKARARLGAGARTADTDVPRNPTEEAALDSLHELPFGCWIEFIADDGRVTRRRLAWFSAETGHALFVNQRGQRVDETTLDQLARQIAAGRARIVHAEQGRVVDRAWHAALQSLRGFTAPKAPAEDATDGQ